MALPLHARLERSDLRLHPGPRRHGLAVEEAKHVMDHFLRGYERFGHDSAISDPGFIAALFDELLHGEAGRPHDDELRIDLAVARVDRAKRALVGLFDD